MILALTGMAWGQVQYVSVNPFLAKRIAGKTAVIAP